MSNQMSENTNEGIVIMDSNYFIIGANSLIGNGNIGIFLDVSSSTIPYRLITNHVVDISNADGIPIHISMNEYFENCCGKALPDGICCRELRHRKKPCYGSVSSSSNAPALDIS